MSSFKSNENIHKKGDGSYYIVSSSFWTKDHRKQGTHTTAKNHKTLIKLVPGTLSRAGQVPCQFNSYFFLISSPEPLGSQGELIVYPYSGVRCRRCHCRRCRHRQQCLNIFSSETALPIKAKFYVESPWEGGTKVCINGPGHMTKMAAMPIYGKNL